MLLEMILGVPKCHNNLSAIISRYEFDSTRILLLEDNCMFSISMNFNNNIGARVGGQISFETIQTTITT